MLSMAFKVRQLSQHLINDATSNYGSSADSNFDEKQSYIEDARKQLDELRLEFPTDANLTESTVWQNKIAINQN